MATKKPDTIQAAAKSFKPEIRREETKTRRLQLLLKPSAYAAAEAYAEAQGLTLNELANQLFLSLASARTGARKK